MRISDICDIRIGHPFRKRLTNVPNGGVKVIQPKNMSSDGTVSFSPGEPLQTDASVSRSLKQGDVLVVSRGRFAATVFDLSSADTWIVPSSIFVLSVTKESVLPEYIALYFNSTNGQRMFRRHYEQTTVPFVSTTNLGNMDIPIPPLEKQHALIAFEGSSKEYARLSNRKLELQRQIITHELMADQESF